MTKTLNPVKSQVSEHQSQDAIPPESPSPSPLDWLGLVSTNEKPGLDDDRWLRLTTDQPDHHVDHRVL